MSIANILVRDRDQSARLYATPPPNWPKLNLSRWPTQSVWVTEFLGRYSVGFELSDPITVHTIFQSPGT